ncbi:MAG: hypothetical protein WCH65_01920 [bacterium]
MTDTIEQDKAVLRNRFPQLIEEKIDELFNMIDSVAYVLVDEYDEI